MKSFITLIVLLNLLIYSSDIDYSITKRTYCKKAQHESTEPDSINVVIRLFTTGISIPPYELDDYRNITGTIEDTVFWVYPNDSTRNIPLVRHRGKDVILHAYKPGFFDKLININKLANANVDTVVSGNYVRLNHMIRVVIDYYDDGEIARSLFIADDFFCIAKEGDRVSVARDKALTREIKKVFKDYRLYIIEYNKTD